MMRVGVATKCFVNLLFFLFLFEFINSIFRISENEQLLLF